MDAGLIHTTKLKVKNLLAEHLSFFHTCQTIFWNYTCLHHICLGVQILPTTTEPFYFFYFLGLK